MTKTTTTCDQCGAEIPQSRTGMLANPIMHLRCTERRNGEEKSYADFCSRFCLAEYLKPKTDTTP